MLKTIHCGILSYFQQSDNDDDMPNKNIIHCVGMCGKITMVRSVKTLCSNLGL